MRWEVSLFFLCRCSGKSRQVWCLRWDGKAHFVPEMTSNGRYKMQLYLGLHKPTRNQLGFSLNIHLVSSYRNPSVMGYLWCLLCRAQEESGVKTLECCAITLFESPTKLRSRSLPIHTHWLSQWLTLLVQGKVWGNQVLPHFVLPLQSLSEQTCYWGVN